MAIWRRFKQLTALVTVSAMLMSLGGCSNTISDNTDSAASAASADPSASDVTGNATIDTSKLTEAADSIVSSENTEESTESSRTYDSVVVSFIGDVTLCSDIKSVDANKGFEYVVDGDLNYCFQNCSEIFKEDDLTIANLEGAVTTSTEHKDKQFVFAMPPDTLKMLTNNGIDAVNLANNHTMDFFEKGYTDTTFNLYCAGITWSDQNTAATYQVGNYKIGMFGICDWDPINLAYQRIEELKTEGCNIIIANCHWGEEAKYEQNDKQTVLAHKLIDKGVDIVVGSHPHRLQPLEKYKDKWIAYSISNFCFGGNTWLSDPDTVILQCEFVMDAETGNCVDYRLNIIPYSQTSSVGNDFCPVPYEWGSDKYYRVLSRLGWSQEDE